MNNGYKTHLLRGASCGTNSHTIYEEYSAIFGWDKTQASQFGRRGVPLYAREATPEGYSVWCISHSNRTATQGGDWTNYISADEETIEELWKEPSRKDCLHDYTEMTTRVVFAKGKQNYEFLGVYQCERRSSVPEKPSWTDAYGYIKTYKRISKIYPIGL